MKKCPYCAEEIQDEAIKCRFCHEMLDTKSSPKDTITVTSKDVSERTYYTNEEIRKLKEKNVEPKIVPSFVETKSKPSSEIKKRTYYTNEEIRKLKEKNVEPKIVPVSSFVETKSKPSSKIRCPYCKEEVLQDAIKCKHCGERLTATTFAENYFNELGNTISTGFNIVWGTLIVLGVLLFVMYTCVASM